MPRSFNGCSLQPLSRPAPPLSFRAAGAHRRLRAPLQPFLYVNWPNQKSAAHPRRGQVATPNGAPNRPLAQGRSPGNVADAICDLLRFVCVCHCDYSRNLYRSTTGNVPLVCIPPARLERAAPLWRGGWGQRSLGSISTQTSRPLLSACRPAVTRNGLSSAHGISAYVHRWTG
jgi:hypothetical protein